MKNSGVNCLQNFYELNSNVFANLFDKNYKREI
jgi:hypothetical protein